MHAEVWGPCMPYMLDEVCTKWEGKLLLAVSFFNFINK